ncbi:MAG: hypothetical protein OCU18_03830 [Candidatus Syntrophoarchaeum sp.]|nr:hypothetical protein [Candidatus Syntrophoarchaeum sp.]
MNDAIKRYKKLATPPAHALKEIRGGRLKGKTDISPQWRIEAMTSEYGECGVGWKFEIVRFWTEQGDNLQVMAFAQINLYTRIKDDLWSAPVPGVGGSMMIEKERNGLHTNDEAWKMAVTDALGTAMKMLGVAADIYMGFWDGSKYIVPDTAGEPVSKEQMLRRIDRIRAIPELNRWYKKHSREIDSLPQKDKDEVLSVCGIKKKELQEILKAAEGSEIPDR